MKPQQPPKPLTEPDDVLKRMLSTPHKTHMQPKAPVSTTKKPAK